MSLSVANQTEITLKAWDELLYNDRLMVLLPKVDIQKLNRVRLIGTTCKSVETHGHKSSSRMPDFFIYLTEEVGFHSVFYSSPKKSV